MNEPLGLVGVPSSAGAFAPGQEKAPGALRDAGLVDRLERAGIRVVDHGDGKAFRWRPDRQNRRAQNLDSVVEIVAETARRVERVASAGEFTLVVGGDCTVGLGTVAGHLPTAERLGVVYFDLHPDLNVPESAKAGALDWMGMAHALGEPAATDRLSRFGPRFPLLADDDVYFFAYGPDNRTDWERERMERRELDGVPIDDVAADPETVARNALAAFGSRFDRLLIHFDVDTIDFTDVPLSENTGRNEGLAFEQAMAALTVLLSAPNVSALTVTEINPDHGDESGRTIETFVDGLVNALSDARTV